MIGEDKEITKLKIRIPTPKVENEEKFKIKKLNWFIYLLCCSCFKKEYY